MESSDRGGGLRDEGLECGWLGMRRVRWRWVGA